MEKEEDQFLSKDGEKEQVSLLKGNANLKSGSKIGFILAVAAYLVMLLKSFIASCISTYQYVFKKSPFSTNGTFSVATQYICQCVCVIGMIVSICEFRKSKKEDIATKVYATVGITLGTVHAISLVMLIFLNIIELIMKALH